MIMWLWITVLLMALLCALFMYVPDWDKRIFRPFLKEGASGDPVAPSKSKSDRYKILRKSKGR
jgi:hypothetical protein